MKTKEIISGILSLLDAYEATRRSHISRDTLLGIKKFHKQIAVTDQLVRESVLEHVGTLPIVAAYLHPHIDEQVDIGHVLKLLAIHDIGETVAGETIIFKTNAETDAQELHGAEAVLCDEQLGRYHEFLDRKTNEAKFAHSVDRFSATLNTLRADMTSEKERREVNGITITKVRKKHDPKQNRNQITWSMHEECMRQFEQLGLPK